MSDQSRNKAFPSWCPVNCGLTGGCDRCLPTEFVQQWKGEGWITLNDDGSLGGYVRLEAQRDE